MTIPWHLSAGVLYVRPVVRVPGGCGRWDWRLQSTNKNSLCFSVWRPRILSPCRWGTPGGSAATELLKNYAAKALRSDDLIGADDDLSYCMECVAEYHRVRDHAPQLHKVTGFVFPPNTPAFSFFFFSRITIFLLLPFT